ncbi:MAG TPA: hypothetical protein VFZ51_00835, partial [Woeseiaceae bacterium]
MADHVRSVDGERYRESPLGKIRRDEYFHLLDMLPAAAYTCNAEGLITWFNARAAEIWGREPKLNDPVERFCGSFRMYSPDGTPIEHNQCWMALALQEDRDYENFQVLIERPDGSRI